MGLFSRKPEATPDAAAPLPSAAFDVFVDLLYVDQPEFAPTTAASALEAGVDHAGYAMLVAAGHADLLASCRHAIRVVDAPPDGLDPRERHARFSAIVRGVVEVTSPALMAVAATAQVVVPETLEDPFLPLLNVRTIASPDVPGATIVDTVGLAAYGLPDLQCHNKGIDSDQLATFLRGIADVILDDPDAIHDGNAIQGLDFHDRWKCKLRASMREPSRRVFDVDPGRHYAPR
jgi:hypothetical protein